MSGRGKASKGSGTDFYTKNDYQGTEEVQVLQSKLYDHSDQKLTRIVCGIKMPVRPEHDYMTPDEIMDYERLLLGFKHYEIEKQKWIRYYEAMAGWRKRYEGKMDTMAAGMSEPNKPNYYRANND